MLKTENQFIQQKNWEDSVEKRWKENGQPILREKDGTVARYLISWNTEINQKIGENQELEQKRLEQQELEEKRLKQEELQKASSVEASPAQFSERETGARPKQKKFDEKQRQKKQKLKEARQLQDNIRKKQGAIEILQRETSYCNVLKDYLMVEKHKILFLLFHHAHKITRIEKSSTKERQGNAKIISVSNIKTIPKGWPKVIGFYIKAYYISLILENLLNKDLIVFDTKNLKEPKYELYEIKREYLLAYKSFSNCIEYIKEIKNSIAKHSKGDVAKKVFEVYFPKLEKRIKEEYKADISKALCLIPTIEDSYIEKIKDDLMSKVELLLTSDLSLLYLESGGKITTTEQVLFYPGSFELMCKLIEDITEEYKKKVESLIEKLVEQHQPSSEENEELKQEELQKASSAEASPAQSPQKETGARPKKKECDVKRLQRRKDKDEEEIQQRAQQELQGLNDIKEVLSIYFEGEMNNCAMNISRGIILRKTIINFLGEGNGSNKELENFHAILEFNIKNYYVFSMLSSLLKNDCIAINQKIVQKKLRDLNRNFINQNYSYDVIQKKIMEYGVTLPQSLSIPEVEDIERIRDNLTNRYQFLIDEVLNNLKYVSKGLENLEGIVVLFVFYKIEEEVTKFLENKLDREHASQSFASVMKENGYEVKVDKVLDELIKEFQPSSEVEGASLLSSSRSLNQ